MSISERILIIFVLIAVPFTLIVLPIYLLTGGLRKFGLRALERRFEGLQLRKQPLAGDVFLVYHTYRGFLLWSWQEEHRGFASERDARELLKRLLRYNLSWGLLSYGMIFIPFLAIGNYYAQKRSIESQATELQFKS